MTHDRLVSRSASGARAELISLGRRVSSARKSLRSSPRRLTVRSSPQCSAIVAVQVPAWADITTSVTPRSPAARVSRRRIWRAIGLALAVVVAGVAADAGAPLYLVAALIVAAAFLRGALNWRWSVYALVLYIPVSGLPIIALYPHTQVPVLAKDFLFVIPCYVGFIGEAIVRRRRASFSGAPTIMLIALALLVLIQAMNPDVPHLLVALIGAKVYLLYLPLIYVGYQMVQSREDLWRLLSLIAIPAAIPCAVGLVEAVLIYGGHGSTVYSWYGPAASAATQKFFTYSLGTPGASLSRIPSTFSFVAQYYLYTIAMIAVVYAWLRGPLRNRERQRWGWALLVLVSTASLLSGSRGAFFFVPGMLILILLLDRVGGIRLLVAALAMVLAFAVALTLIGAQLGPTLTSISSDAGSNGGLIFSWVPRALHLTLTGLGTGLDTGASRYAYPGQNATVAFQSIGGVWLETWWVKIMVEIGLPGLAVVLGLLAQVVGGGFRRHLRLEDPQLRSVSAALLAVLIWNIVYSAKGQNMDFDPMDVYFWLFAGVLARVHALDREAATAPVTEPSSLDQKTSTRRLGRQTFPALRA